MLPRRTSALPGLPCADQLLLTLCCRRRWRCRCCLHGQCLELCRGACCVLAQVCIGVILHGLRQLQQHIHQVLYLQAGQAGRAGRQGRQAGQAPGVSSRSLCAGATQQVSSAGDGRPNQCGAAQSISLAGVTTKRTMVSEGSSLCQQGINSKLLSSPAQALKLQLGRQAGERAGREAGGCGVVHSNDFYRMPSHPAI